MSYANTASKVERISGEKMSLDELQWLRAALQCMVTPIPAPSSSFSSDFRIVPSAIGHVVLSMDR